MSNILGTSFATGNFSYDPNLSPNNLSFGAAVLAVVRRAGIGTGGGGGGTGSVTSVAGTSIGTGSSALVISGGPITTSGTLTFALKVFDGTHEGVVTSTGAGGTLNYLRADGSFATPPGGGTFTGVDFAMAGVGTDCGTWSNQHITSSGTATLTLNAFNGTLAGVVPESSGGVTNYLRADGTWSQPASGGVTGVDFAMGGVGTDCGTWSNQHITSSGTATLTLNAFNGTLAGLVPESAGGTSNYLRADGAWANTPGGALVTVFIETNGATQTWTAAPGSMFTRVICIGGGGGGGGGAISTGSNAGGGGGGGAGGVSMADYISANIAPSQVITFSGNTVGTGGAPGGTATSGGAGQTAAFGTPVLLKAYGGGNGVGGTQGGANSAAGGTGGLGNWNSGGAGGAGGNAGGQNAASGVDLNVTALNTLCFSATGGGGGGGAGAGNAVGLGGRGGQDPATGYVIGMVGGTGGTAGHLNGGMGASYGIIVSSGGGGGGGGTNIAGNGGAGGGYGAGGGGGGASTNQGSAQAGTGGAGGDAAVIVIEWGSSIFGLTGANPSVHVSTTATNGIATTYMRSDAAPAIDQAMNPTWTGTHIWTAVTTSTPSILVNAAAGGNPKAISVTGTGTVGVWGLTILNTQTTNPADFAGISICAGTATQFNTDLEIYMQGDGKVVFFDGQNNNMSFYTNAAEKFRISGTTTSPQIQGYGPVNAGLVDMTPDVGSWVGTFGGLTSSVVGTAWWARHGNVVNVAIPYGSGSSNATTFTFNNVPASLIPTRTQLAGVPVVVNTAATGGGSVKVVAASATYTFLQGTGGAWTSSGPKAMGQSAIWQTINYLLN
ncbi:MAG TPA: hypothetical protein VMH26_18315 [Burkholderiales bacterium]|nr:hypothetical protein [Burkholderiales bacterium]